MKSQSINAVRSEALTLAHAIFRQNSFLTFGQCQVQAWKVVRLRSALKVGAVRFTFQKQDGQVRTALGALNQELFSYTTKGADRNYSPIVIKYFDLEKGSFRSFRAERILQVAA